MTYLTAICYFRHYPDSPTSLQRISLFNENIKSLKVETETLIVELPPHVLNDSVRLKAGFPIHLGLNYAIRRAKGDFILLSARDDIFNEPLAKFLESKQLQRNTLYRIDRTDVRMTDHYGSLDEMRGYCERNAYKVNSMWESYVKNRHLMSATRLRFWPHQVPYTNASGDFLLMHREHWFELRGIPELVGNGLHLDSFMVYSAIYSGLKQVILRPPLQLYHLDHPRVAHTASPHLMGVLDAMRRLRKPLLLNDENWGMHEEIIIK
jgi:hypothetical protein